LSGEPVLEVFSGADYLEWCSVASLAQLHSLTRLAINVSGQDPQHPPKCDEVFWRSMAKLTTLRSLYINDLFMEYFGGIVELTSCKQLTHLLIDHHDLYQDFEMKVRLLQRAVNCSGCYALVMSAPAIMQ
jgi:hypothetical protein